MSVSAESDKYKLTDLHQMAAPAVGDRPVDTLSAPRLRTPRIRLAPVTPNSYDVVARLTVEDENLLCWRYRGRTPSPEEVIRDLWAGVLCQFLVVSTDTGHPLGLVVAYDADLHSGTAYLAVVSDRSARRTGLPLEAMGVFLGYLFGTFALRKLYLEVPEFNLDQFGRQIDRFATLEGCKTDHLILGGRYWDLRTYCIGRARWETQIAPLITLEEVAQ